MAPPLRFAGPVLALLVRQTAGPWWVDASSAGAPGASSSESKRPVGMNPSRRFIAGVVLRRDGGGVKGMYNGPSSPVAVAMHTIFAKTPLRVRSSLASVVSFVDGSGSCSKPKRRLAAPLYEALLGDDNAGDQPRAREEIVCSPRSGSNVAAGTEGGGGGGARPSEG